MRQICVDQSMTDSINSSRWKINRLVLDAFDGASRVNSSFRFEHVFLKRFTNNVIRYTKNRPTILILM